MGTLDDAIREHLELKRRLGASEDELKQKETEAFGPLRSASLEPSAGPAPSEREHEFQVERTPSEGDRKGGDADPWAPAGAEEDLLEPDEVLPQDALDPNGAYLPPAEQEPPPAADELHEDPLDEWEEEPAPTEDVLEETPEFLEETPEHDRLWFEQKPPKDFDFE
jgi:hypothetical protein